jgi:hypothetical protein
MVGKHRETTESLKRHEFRLFPLLERVAIFYPPLFYFTTFHETSFISVPREASKVIYLPNVDKRLTRVVLITKNTQKFQNSSKWGSFLLIDGAASGVTKRRHDVTFPLLTLHCGKRSCTFFYKICQNENIVYAGVLHIFDTKNR